MTDLKLFGTYNLCARFAPGFLFIVSIYILKGYDLTKLETNSFVYIVAIVILSFACGSTSANIIKIAERLFWGEFGNPIIIYLKYRKKDLYDGLFKKFRNDDVVKTEILKATREDEKLLWKNILYGFFRNSILLSIVSMYFSYSVGYFCTNFIVFLLIIVMTSLSSFLYAQQAIESYIEIGSTRTLDK